MEAMTYVLDDRVWTREERDALPDDGSRYELIDGALVVTPAPHWRHQWVASSMYDLPRASCPNALKVMFAPTAVALAPDTVLEPDVFVAARTDFDPARRDLAVPPVLVVEVLSPSTRLVDRNMKLPRFERAGCQSFWLLDPDVPSLTAWELAADGQYVEVAHVVGDETWTATLPFPVTIRPADLLL